MSNNSIKNILLIINFGLIAISLFSFNNFAFLYVFIFLTILSLSLVELKKQDKLIINHQINFIKINDDLYEIRENEINKLGTLIKKEINEFFFWFYCGDKDIILSPLQMDYINQKLKNLNNTNYGN